ncbi:MAG: prepilin-type N-terminal cleavage/methylation domain-containing protein [Betaproteobacteria bacterium]
MFAVAHRGFTLIELLVAMTIAFLLLMLALPQYTAWIADGAVRNGAESVASGLRQTQLAAISQNRDAIFTLGANGWTAEIVGPPLALVHTASLSEGANYVTVAGVNAALAAATTVSFNALGQVIPNAANLVQVDFSNPSTTKALRVLVGNGRTGVKLCDPSISVVSHPRYCPP